MYIGQIFQTLLHFTFFWTDSRTDLSYSHTQKIRLNLTYFLTAKPFFITNNDSRETLPAKRFLITNKSSHERLTAKTFIH